VATSSRSSRDVGHDVSLARKVEALVAGIVDPRVRVDVMSTVNFLYSLFVRGKVSEEEVFRDLVDVCSTVIRLSEPGLAEEEVRDRASSIADGLLTAMKVEGLSRRALYRYLARTPL